MRVLSLLIGCALAACVYNPDPRSPSPKEMQQSGKGAWIVVTQRDGSEIAGELLAIDQGVIYVKKGARDDVSIPLYNVRGADVFKYESDWGFGLWGTLGTLSTISHGVFLVFTAPIWILSSSIAAGYEAAHVRLQIPDDDIAEITKWARYPQGMPKAKQAPPADQRTAAWQLTKEAQQAARAGKCEEVAGFDRRVRELDADIYALTFLRDEAIRRCLGMPSLLVPPGETQPVPSPPGMTPPVPSPPGMSPAAPTDAGVPANGTP